MTKETAYVANGCFWCSEAIFQKVKGVISVVPGYSGGKSLNPTYEDVSTGDSGHAEAIKIDFNSNVLSYKHLLEIFFSTHNPTTLNQQGADIGSQYRSAIFYVNQEQQTAANDLIQELTKNNVYDDPIVTEVVKFTNFFEAENYHKNYYLNNKNKPYCMIVINPKINKLIKEFKEDLIN